MKIIVPMAGRGSRLRPHTLTIPKPLVPVAGMPIVNRLVCDIVNLVNTPIEEIAFILGDPAFFGKDVEESLLALSSSLGAKGVIYRQLNPLGTGHAIMCAEPSLSGPAIVAYADTLIRANFTLDPNADAVIWVKKVNNPEAYGVVKQDHQGYINSLVEKPSEFVSDLAAIGIYYFKDIGALKTQLQHVLDSNLTHGGEYQINDGILQMIQQGKRFVPGEVSAWMDCGNPTITIQTNQEMLQFIHQEGQELISTKYTHENSTIISPCFIGEGVVLENSTVGPYVSVGPKSKIINSSIKNSIVQSESTIINADLQDSMVGNKVYYDGHFKSVSIGDYSTLK